MDKFLDEDSAMASYVTEEQDPLSEDDVWFTVPSSNPASIDGESPLTTMLGEEENPMNQGQGNGEAGRSVEEVSKPTAHDEYSFLGSFSPLFTSSPVDNLLQIKSSLERICPLAHHCSTWGVIASPQGPAVSNQPSPMFHLMNPKLQSLPEPSVPIGSTSKHDPDSSVACFSSEHCASPVYCDSPQRRVSPESTSPQRCVSPQSCASTELASPQSCASTVPASPQSCASTVPASPQFLEGQVNEPIASPRDSNAAKDDVPSSSLAVSGGLDSPADVSAFEDLELAPSIFGSPIILSDYDFSPEMCFEENLEVMVNEFNNVNEIPVQQELTPRKISAPISGAVPICEYDNPPEFDMRPRWQCGTENESTEQNLSTGLAKPNESTEPAETTEGPSSAVSRTTLLRSLSICITAEERALADGALVNGAQQANRQQLRRSSRIAAINEQKRLAGNMDPKKEQASEKEQTPKPRKTRTQKRMANDGVPPLDVLESASDLKSSDTDTETHGACKPKQTKTQKRKPPKQAQPKTEATPKKKSAKKETKPIAPKKKTEKDAAVDAPIPVSREMRSRRASIMPKSGINTPVKPTTELHSRELPPKFSGSVFTRSRTLSLGLTSATDKSKLDDCSDENTPMKPNTELKCRKLSPKWCDSFVSKFESLVITSATNESDHEEGGYALRELGDENTNSCNYQTQRKSPPVKVRSLGSKKTQQKSRQSTSKWQYGTENESTEQNLSEDLAEPNESTEPTETAEGPSSAVSRTTLLRSLSIRITAEERALADVAIVNEQANRRQLRSSRIAAINEQKRLAGNMDSRNEQVSKKEQPPKNRKTRTKKRVVNDSVPPLDVLESASDLKSSDTDTKTHGACKPKQTKNQKSKPPKQVQPKTEATSKKKIAKKETKPIAPKKKTEKDGAVDAPIPVSRELRPRRASSMPKSETNTTAKPTAELHLRELSSKFEGQVTTRSRSLLLALASSNMPELESCSDAVGEWEDKDTSVKPKTELSKKLPPKHVELVPTNSRSLSQPSTSADKMEVGDCTNASRELEKKNTSLKPTTELKSVTWPPKCKLVPTNSRSLSLPSTSADKMEVGDCTNASQEFVKENTSLKPTTELKSVTTQRNCESFVARFRSRILTSTIDKSELEDCSDAMRELEDDDTDSSDYQTHRRPPPVKVRSFGPKTSQQKSRQSTVKRLIFTTTRVLQSLDTEEVDADSENSKASSDPTPVRMKKNRSIQRRKKFLCSRLQRFGDESSSSDDDNTDVHSVADNENVSPDSSGFPTNKQPVLVSESQVEESKPAKMVIKSTDGIESSKIPIQDDDDSVSSTEESILSEVETVYSAPPEAEFSPNKICGFLSNGYFTKWRLIPISLNNRSNIEPIPSTSNAFKDQFPYEPNNPPVNESHSVELPIKQPLGNTMEKPSTSRCNPEAATLHNLCAMVEQKSPKNCSLKSLTMAFVASSLQASSNPSPMLIEMIRDNIPEFLELVFSAKLEHDEAITFEGIEAFLIRHGLMEPTDVVETLLAKHLALQWGCQLTLNAEPSPLPSPPPLPSPSPPHKVPKPDDESK